MNKTFRSTALLSAAFMVLLATFASCGPGADLCGGVPCERSFWTIDNRYPDYATNTNAWKLVDAEVRGYSNHCVVYVDVNRPDVTDMEAQALADEFEAVIHPKVTRYFASPLDVDGNKKTILLVYDILDDYQSTGAYYGGYFFSIDLFSQQSIDQYNNTYDTVYKSNEGDILHIDCNPQDIGSVDAHRSIAHEFEHLVNYSYYLNNKTASNPTDVWIDEGLAEAANHLCFGTCADRVDYYNTSSDSTSSPNTYGYIRDGQSLFYWDGSASDKVLVNYALSYLFFQYLRIHSASGWDIYRSVIQSSYGDYRAIVNALNNDGNYTVTGTWGSTGTERFKRLLMRFYLANSMCRPSGLYGYEGLLSLDPHLYTGGPSSPSLKCGGGIVKNMTSTFNGTDSNFYYMSVSSDGATEDFTSTYSNLDRFAAVYYGSAYDATGTDSGSTLLPSGNIVIGDAALQNNALLRGSLSSEGDASPRSYKIDMIAPPGLASGFDGLKKAGN